MSADIQDYQSSKMLCHSFEVTTSGQLQVVNFPLISIAIILISFTGTKVAGQPHCEFIPNTFILGITNRVVHKRILERVSNILTPLITPGTPNNTK